MLLQSQRLRSIAARASPSRASWPPMN